MRAPFLAIPLVCAIAPDALAVTLRYAVVVGNNVSGEAASLPDLLHAEREAQLLRGKLVDTCNFPDDRERTALLIRPTRAELGAAIGALKERMAADRIALGEVDTIFAFFFTGHGLDGKILLADGPLPSAEIAALLKSVSAKLTIGVFDACYSASLDPGTLLEKGVRPHRSADVFKELPDEVLTAEGTTWLLSSGPDEASYEDSRLGGLFTHYFIEALEQADSLGPGISLDQIWSYARSRTEARAREQNRAQTPRRIVSRMKEQGSLLFSFPASRDATLVLAENLTGHFLLSYAGGQLTERIDKPSPGPKAVAVYAGRARLTKIGDGRSSVGPEMRLEAGDALVISDLPDGPKTGLGKGSTALFSKGESELSLRADRVSDSSWYLGVSGSGAICGRACLQPGLAAGLALRWDTGPFSSALSLAYAHGGESFAAWAYDLDGALVGVQSGYAIDPLEALRVSLRLGISTGAFRQRFEDGVARTTWLIRPELALDLAWSITDELALAAQLGVGLAIARSAGIEGEIQSRPAALFSVGPLWRPF
jgi:hypothetical protein